MVSTYRTVSISVTFYCNLGLAHADLLANLLVNDNIDQGPRYCDAPLVGDQVLKCEVCDHLLDLGFTPTQACLASFKRVALVGRTV